ncbi:hypothetical protein CYG49_04430 [Candidatus Saccharibacteria bacterium]|nr:MAG: hypothetical protein CYG49_04430 [Candidatus Saccharibacteria bacterium]
MDSILSTIGFILSVLVGIFLLVLLVVVHELGHAIAARRNGVVVEEFGIGFPPRAWAKKLKNGVLFTLNWLPLGGFVKLKGEHDSADQEGDYGATSLWVKAKILLAGVAVNYVTAIIIFTVLALFGLPKVLPDQFYVKSDTAPIAVQPVEIAKVTKGSPADKAGIKEGDRIISVNGKELEVAGQLSNITRENAGKAIAITLERNGERQSKEVTLNRTSGEQGYLGIRPNAQQAQYIRATWSAPIVGVMTSLQFTEAYLKGLGTLLADVGRGIASKFSGDRTVREEGSESLQAAERSVAGPVGILGQIFPNALDAGIIWLLFLTGIISLTLAIMNILPIPALDGGRLFLAVLFRAIRKPLTKEREETIVGTSFLILMALVLLITVLDIRRISNG